MKHLLLQAILMSLFLNSCSVEQSPIVYGKEACSFCKMNIVDKQHAAEIVTERGKPYKYDAIECMLRDLRKRDENEVELFLINDYSAPGEFIDAKSATYLISDNLQSPMGANLTGFNDNKEAKLVLKEKGGKLYNWNQLKDQF